LVTLIAESLRIEFDATGVATGNVIAPRADGTLVKDVVTTTNIPNLQASSFDTQGGTSAGTTWVNYPAIRTTDYSGHVSWLVTDAKTGSTYTLTTTTP